MTQSHQAGTALEQRAAILILIAAMAVASLLYLRSIGVAEDDAYITFRYAANARAGHGLVYNEGQRVCGVSTPFYLLAVTGASRTLPSTPVDVVALRMNLVPFMATGLLIYLLLWRFTGTSLLSAVIAGAVVLDAKMLSQALDGMESTWFLMWLFASLWAIDRRSPVLSGVLCGLAALTRPEGALLLPIAAIAFRKSRRELAMVLTFAVLTIAPWLVFAAVYYGTPIPHSIIAKARPLYPIPRGHAFHTMVDVLHPAWLSSVVFAAGVVAFSIQRARPIVLLFCAFVIFYAVANPFMMPWYYPPLEVLGLLCLSLTFLGLARITKTNGRPWVFPLTVTGLLAVTIIPHIVTPLERRLNTPERLRVSAYREAARRLKELASPQDLVVAPEVGAIGYFYERPIIDGCALVSPEVLPYIPVPAADRLSPEVGALSPKFVEDLRPKWIVTIPIFIRGGLATREWFLEAYRIAARIPLPVETFSEREVLLLRRRA